MTKPKSPAPEIDALRYVTGEMTPDEQAAYEERLAEDLQACEAVAASVQIVAALRCTSDDTISRPDVVPSSAPPARRLRQRAPARMISAALIAAAVISGAVVWQWQDAFLPTESETDPAQTARLIAAWTTPDPGLTSEEWLLASLADPHDDAADMIADPEDDLTVPRWMLRAVQTGLAAGQNGEGGE